MKIITERIAVLAWVLSAALLVATSSAFGPVFSNHAKSILSNNNVHGDQATTISLFSSSSSSSNDIDDDFMASLQKRMTEVQESDQRLPLIVLDAMLPGQVLNITIKNPLLKTLLKTRWQEETPSLGMVGYARLQDGRQVTLSSGVEVEVLGTPIVTDDGSLKLSLKGARRFRVQEDTVETTEQGWTEATVQYLNATLDDHAEESDSDPMSIARAMQMAREFTDPNFSLSESKSLVDMWLTLARKHERRPHQIDNILNDLGPAPSWKNPTDCAFWVAALINPIPALGALEVRPKMLLAKTAKARTQIALDGIWNSIQQMEAMEGKDRFQKIKE